MAIMAPAAPEQALTGLIRCCTGPAFGAANSSFPVLESNSAFHHLDWQTLQAMQNSHTTMAAPLGSPGVGNDWEQLLYHPSHGFELPLWSSTKAAGGGDDVTLQAKSGDPADARSTLLQQQVLEAVEESRGDAAAAAAMDALVASIAAAPPENAPPGAPCSEGVHQAGPSTTTSASPSRSPHRHGDDHPASLSRKRKQDRPSPDPKGVSQGAEAGEGVKSGKRCRRESRKGKGRERSCSETSGESGEGAGTGKENQLPKQQADYIHVRARRGQATDSHSLAERVRREKMSERMKFLQDLVPGCRKVTGKAVMLDEIINYVQSLQRQVESLSMKLAAVSSTQQSSHWTLESLLSNKEILQAQFSSNSAAAAAAAAGPYELMQQQPPVVAPPPQPTLPLPFGFDFRASGNDLEHVGCGGTPSLRSPIAAGLADLACMRPFDSSVSQFTSLDGELESVVHMGLHQHGHLGSFAGHLHCQLPVGRMKIEF